MQKNIFYRIYPSKNVQTCYAVLILISIIIVLKTGINKIHSCSRYQETVERGDLRMTFTSHHRPLQEYFAALESAGLSVEALREPTVDESSVIERADRARWLRLPLFLDLRARKR